MHEGFCKEKALLNIMENAQNASSSTVMDLPYDCLVFILKRLSCESDRKALGLTCRRWLEIQNYNCQSLQFDCSLTNFMVDTYKLHRTLTCFPHLQSLSLSGCTELPDSGLSLLQNYGPTLRALRIDCCFKITDNGLSLVTTGCSSLTFISLYCCNVTNTGLETLAKDCLGLEFINLSYCSLITNKGIKPVVQNCLKLHAILISHCEGITGVGFQGCSQSLAYLEAESCKLEPEGILDIVSGGGLKYLNIASLSWSIRGDGLAAIGSGLTARLRVLNMRLCGTIRDKSIGEIAKGCPSLVEWNLALCHEIRVGVNCLEFSQFGNTPCQSV